MHRAEEFSAINAQGRRLRGKVLDLKLVAGDHPLRVGIVVPRHAHTAVARNKLKRRLREIVRASAADALPRGDAVLMARTEAYEETFGGLAEAFRELCGRALGRQA